MTYTRKPLRCPCCVEVRTIKQLERHQYAAHDVGVAVPPRGATWKSRRRRGGSAPCDSGGVTRSPVT